MPPTPRRVCLLGATGTIGRAVRTELRRRGNHVTCLLRPSATVVSGQADDGAILLATDVTSPEQLVPVFESGGFDAVLSCMASRTGAPRDAWAIDHQAHLNVLEAARHAGVGQFVLLSAICVQKPRLPFQHAKLAFEAALAASGLRYSIVRPTAYFKSLTGQITRVRAGKPFLLFGDGTRTACKPVSDRDLATYLVACLNDPDKQNRILPIGGPGPAITPRDQAQHLFALLGQQPRLTHVPLAMMDAIVAMLALAAPFAAKLAAKADLARIGRYYATESMLWLNPATGAYDAAATPETGADTLFATYAAIIAGAQEPDRGAHAVF